MQPAPLPFKQPDADAPFEFGEQPCDHGLRDVHGGGGAGDGLVEHDRTEGFQVPQSDAVGQSIIHSEKT